MSRYNLVYPLLPHVLFGDTVATPWFFDSKNNKAEM